MTKKFLQMIRVAASNPTEKLGPQTSGVQFSIIIVLLRVKRSTW